MSTDRSDLISRARERANRSSQPEDWGYRVSIDVHGEFVCRWRGETTDGANGDRRVFLLWDDDDDPCWHRYYVSLGREIDRVRPDVGDRVVICRGEDYPTSYDNPGQNYGVAKGPCPDPLPREVSPTGGGGRDDIPYRPTAW